MATSSWLAKQRKQDLVELAEGVGLKMYKIPAFLGAFLAKLTHRAAQMD